MTDEAALELRDVVKRYGAVEALRGIAVQVRSGECVTVLGPSGSGKTTLLRIVAGFTHPTEGDVRIAGRDVSHASPADRGVGMVFQDYSLFPHMSVEANVAYGLKVRGWKRTARADRVREMLDVVGLTGMERRMPRQLSGGQQQRVALARALAFDPELLLMDEPLGALDRELRVRMTGELGRIRRALGTTLVYVTHDRDEALTLSDRIIIMRDGRVEDVGVPSDLYDAPRTEFVARFFGWHNVVGVQVASTADGCATVDWLGRAVSLACSDGVDIGMHTLVVPTHAVRLVSDPAPDLLTIKADILEALYMGEQVRLRLGLPDGRELVSHVAPGGPVAIELGTHVTVALDPSRLRVVPRDPSAAAAVEASEAGDEPIGPQSDRPDRAAAGRSGATAEPPPPIQASP